ncbi:MAG: COX15/CtaA family protein [Planctomycetota bacterium]
MRNSSSETEPAEAGYPPYRRWLHALAMLLVIATFILVAIGGHVTSKDAGMAVPDGFTTFGVWSLVAPLESWWYEEGTRLEHSHRLKGYVVGGLTLALMLGFFATQRPRKWVLGLGVVLLLFVLVQALMGIVRVDENSVFLAGVHGVTGQVFLCLTVLATAAVGKFWMTRPTRPPASPADQPRSEDASEGSSGGTPRHARSLRVLPLVLLAALLVQLVLGSAVRHSKSALAIPDWPTHYGQLVPPMSQEKLDAAVAAYPAEELPERYGRATEVSEARPYTAGQVHLHFAHRLGAYAVLAFGVWFVAYTFKHHATQPAVLIPAGLFGVFLLLQVALGVMTVWSGEHATLATSHQTVGALLIATATWLTIRLHLVPCPKARPAHIPVAAGDATTECFRSDPTPPEGVAAGADPQTHTPPAPKRTPETSPEPITA